MPVPPPATPTEPSMNGNERDTLIDFLDYFRTVLARKAWGLTDEQLRTRVAASSLTIGGLLKHMALVEDDWFQCDLLGRELPEPWASAPFDDDRDWEMSSAATDSLEELLTQFEISCDRSRAAIAGIDSLDHVCARTNRDGDPINLRWIMVHMIEEYARHCGHADFIREAIDGRTGD